MSRFWTRGTYAAFYRCPTFLPKSSVRVEQVSNTIIQKIERMDEVPSTDPMLWSKFKAISALFPYAAHLARGEQRGMIESILRISSKLSSRGFMWHRIGPYITSLFDESSPPLNNAITIAAPCANWIDGLYTQGAVARWAAAVLETPYSEAVCQSVVGALLSIAPSASLRPHIPVEIWAWLKKRPFLPPTYEGRLLAALPEVIRHIQGLGDIELLKSYFLLVWSEWEFLHPLSPTEMAIVIRNQFCGIEMWRHRKDLTERLDQVLSQLDRGLEYLEQYNPRMVEVRVVWARRQYRQLKEVLAEVDGEEVKI